MARTPRLRNANGYGPDANREKSLAIMKTSLQSCVSAVLFARSILPSKAFTRESMILDASTKDTLELVTLARGPSVRANHLLDWLHHGAFAALNQNILSAMQICIHPDAKRRNRALETYTFTIQYVAGPGGDLAPATFSLDEAQEQHPASANATERDLHRIITNISELCSDLQALPSSRYLSMNLFLLPNPSGCPPLDGFSKARRDTSLFPQHADWAMRTESFDRLSSDCHKARLLISYMAYHQHKHENEENIDMSKLVDYSEAVPLDRDIDIHMARMQNQRRRTIQPAHEATKRVEEEQLTAAINKNGSHDAEKQPPIKQDADTQASTLANIAAALNGMNQSEILTQGDTQAAPLSLNVEDLSTRHDNSTATRPVQQYEYDLGTLHHQRADAATIRRQAHELAKDIGGITRSGQVILCHCAYSKEEGDMIRCTMCHTWQHIHCHGYVGKDDPRRPSEHLCYICFINPKEAVRLREMVSLALARRAVFRAAQYGIVGKNDFAEKLGVHLGIAQPLFTELRENGCVIAATGSHKAGFKATGKPPWVPATGEAYKKTLDTYFDPTKLIQKYFKPYPQPPSANAELLNIPSVSEMPLAATPIREKRKRAVLTPSSNLDTPEAERVTHAASEDAIPGMRTRGRAAQDVDNNPDPDDETEQQYVHGTRAAVQPTKKAKNNQGDEQRKLIGYQSDRIIDVRAKGSSASAKR